MSLLVVAAIAASSLIPLNDLGPAPYDYGYFGGLWENGTNDIPAEHLAAGMAFSNQIQPLDAEGKPSGDGKIVFLTLGTSDASAIACYPVAQECQDFGFVARAQKDPRLRKHVTFVDGSLWGSTPHDWSDQSGVIYDRVDQYQLQTRGLTPAQVQVAWVLLTTPKPLDPMPVQVADAYTSKVQVSTALRMMKTRYPNLQIIYLSSSVYRGYSAVGEPYGYEAGYLTRFLTVGQVETMRVAHLGPHWDTRMGSLNYATGIIPWLTWGPYLWANGTTPRSDGLTWQRSDFGADGDSLSRAGAEKGATMLLEFLKKEPTAQHWIGPDETPGRRRPTRH